MADIASHGSQAPPSTLQKETVHTTQKHPWLTTKGWIKAGDLHIGDHVQRLDGTMATVVALVVVPGEQDMYDLSVSHVHTFAVGVQQFVVHNCDFKTFYGKNKKVFINEEEARATYNAVKRHEIRKRVFENDGTVFRKEMRKLSGKPVKNVAPPGQKVKYNEQPRYREYTVAYRLGSDRGTRRIVVDTFHNVVYFTRNHYRSFKRLR